MARILIVEDDATNLQIVVRLLRREGHEALTAGNAEQGVALALSERPDLILMDITIPDVEGATPHIEGGLKATRVIRNAPETAQTPIIAVTARCFAQEQQAIQEAGCNGIATKPFEFSTLLQEVRKQLAAAN